MDGVSSAASVIGLLEAAIRSIKRLRKAYERVKDAPKVFDTYQTELEGTKSIIAIVEDEISLQTANVQSELEKLKSIDQKIRGGLTKAEERSKKFMAQFSHQLFSGSKEEEQLSSIMRELIGVKTSICLHIQLSAVGVIRDMENRLVAKLDIINRVNDTLVELLGQAGSLRIVGLLKNRNPQSKGKYSLVEQQLTYSGDGTILLSAEDEAYVFGKAAGGGDQTIRTERVIVGNMTQDQAIQINGPLGKDLWKNVIRLEIRDNKAFGKSVQINHATTMEAAEWASRKQKENIEEERKEKAGRLGRVNSADSGIDLDDSD
jgi:hypothetical protein